MPFRALCDSALKGADRDSLKAVLPKRAVLPRIFRIEFFMSINVIGNRPSLFAVGELGFFEGEYCFHFWLAMFSLRLFFGAVLN